jgi:outer membrane protein
MENEKIEKGTGNNKFAIFATLNVIILIGVIILYVMQFSGGAKLKDDVETALDSLGKVDAKLVYVNSDEIVANYYLTDVLKKQFETEKKRLENDFSKKQRDFQKEVENFQRSVQLGTMSMENAQKKEQELMVVQQRLYELNDSYTEKLMVLEMEMQTQVTDSLTNFLTRFNAEKGYDFILGYARGGGILYANPALDITKEVIEELKKSEPKK